MPNVIEGDPTPPLGRYAVVAARFNSLVVDALCAGAVETLRRHGVPDAAIDVYKVPGSFELPFVAGRLAAANSHAAVIALGCIIRGDTDHYDHVAGAATSGLAGLAKSGPPVIFGVLTCDTLEQALHRAGGKAGNKGSEAALAAIEMASLASKLPGGRA
jgi:6,7-dimethyl-8-ribityllumazine synthase